ncbi:MAG: Glu/Leu/Phe/Val dehydrogenase [Alphaproteobacteria bacterium]|nr:Glu/Leu/Phe/Val dehydrogenase [Alphaproteobacteria bacterium]
MNNAAEFYNELEDFKTRFDAMEPALELTVKDEAMGIEGFVVVWNTAIAKDGPLSQGGKGCGKGGSRIMKGLKLDDVKRLARAMAEKNSAAGLPLGGAKSGLNADPDAPDYEKKWKRFVRLVKEEGVLCVDGGIFGGFGYDVGGKPPLNALWTIEELGDGKSFTGKPVDKGGTDYDKIGIAGLGVAVAGKTLMEENGKSAQDATFSVQGVGAMGSAVMRFFSEMGGKLQYVSDPKYGGTWHFENGATEEFIQEPSMENLEAEATKISDSYEDCLYQDVDIIFPCALEDTLTKDNAGKVKAKFMSEGANNPTTDEAHQILFDNGTLVIPDIIANPGGIIAAFVELSSNADDLPAEAMKMTRERVADNVRTMMKYVQDLKTVRPDQIADYMTYKNILKDENQGQEKAA